MDDAHEAEEVFAQDGPALFDESTQKRTSPVPTDKASTVPEPPLALYRRYRPEVFSEIIGQEHVTEPLKRALTNNRVNHAYLFSGPRGCGKTSSARILARSLNCEQGPTPDPCGVCQSCRDLSRNGPGSIDVIEIDAASHGGVDDARDLRERAFFAPVYSRYKIYIVDEAHMVTVQGFNALLKLVEEPPPHVKFIFATTEPDKVIGTIRSRTHHYPFRLIPPKTMASYLTTICEEEHVQVEQGVIPMVVRAGAGSVRDSLSVLDQLLGGADANLVKYAQAAALLGYTPDSLLDEVIDAFANDNSQGVFSAIDKVIESGQDPRRFTEDLLRRFRDLMVVAAVPDALSSGLIDVAGDQGERFTVQAKGLGIGALTRAAEILAAGLVAMRGTTAPRLNLELMCSRILLPGADTTERGIYARLERLEKRVDGGTVVAPVGSAAPSTPAPTPGSSVQPSASPAPTVQAKPTPPERPAQTQPAPVPSAPPRPSPPREQRQEQAPHPVEPSAAGSMPAPQATPTDGPTIDDIRKAWPQIMDRVKSTRKFLWMVLTQFASATHLVQKTLWLTFKDAGSRESFNRANGEEQVRQAVVAQLGCDIAVRARLDSEPIPANGGTAILSLADRSGAPHPTAPAGQMDVGPSEQSAKPTPQPPTSQPSASAEEHTTPGQPSADPWAPSLGDTPVPPRPASSQAQSHADPQPTDDKLHPKPGPPVPHGAPPAATSTRPATPSTGATPASRDYPPDDPYAEDESDLDAPDSESPVPEEPDAGDDPDIDTDAVVEGSDSIAEELVEEILDAELVKEEETKSASPKPAQPKRKPTPRKKST